MVVSFLHYQPTVVSPVQLNGAVIERVPNYKLLGVIITENLTWNDNCDYIHKIFRPGLSKLHLYLQHD